MKIQMHKRNNPHPNFWVSKILNHTLVRKNLSQVDFVSLWGGARVVHSWTLQATKNNPLLNVDIALLAVTYT